jgi:hypothetical protein
MSGTGSAVIPVAALDTSVLVAAWSRIALQNIAETWRVPTWRWARRGLAWDDL